MRSRHEKPGRTKGSLSRRHENWAPQTASRFALPSRHRDHTTEHVRATARTAYLVYFKCAKCGNVWDVDVPSLRGRQRSGW